MKHTALTLIELIVVIAIIVLLIAVLVPVSQSFRQQARATQCALNINQLLQALLLYEAENKMLPFAFDDTPAKPPPDGYPGNSAYDKVGWWWFSHIEGFFDRADKKKNVIQCPSKKLGSQELNGDILCGNYGVNQSICKISRGSRKYAEFVGMSLSISEIPQAGRILLVVDSGYSIINWWHATDIPPVTFNNKLIEDTSYVPGLWINKQRILWPGQEQDAINGRHPKKTVNVGFADGHVSRVKADDLFVKKTDNGYENRSPLWLPK